MANTQDLSFVKQFESDVHIAYQQSGAKLRHTVRVKTGVKGESLTFQKVGKGSASSKTRNGDITPMELDHSSISVTLVDRYAGDYIDELDQLKMNHDEKGVIKTSISGALGRTFDGFIITAGNTSTNVIGTGAATDYSTPAISPSENAFRKVKAAIKALNKAEVPDDGQRFCLVTPDVWDLLLDVDKFARAEYVGNDLPFLKGTEARKFMNVIFMMHNGLTITGVNAAQYSTCLMYHKTALGLGEAKQADLDVWWDGRKQSHWVSGKMSGGAGLIDSQGCVKILINNGL